MAERGLKTDLRKEKREDRIEITAEKIKRTHGSTVKYASLAQGLSISKNTGETDARRKGKEREGETRKV